MPPDTENRSRYSLQTCHLSFARRLAHVSICVLSERANFCREAKERWIMFSWFRGCGQTATTIVAARWTSITNQDCKTFLGRNFIFTTGVSLEVFNRYCSPAFRSKSPETFRRPKVSSDLYQLCAQLFGSSCWRSTFSEAKAFIGLCQVSIASDMALISS